MSQPSHTSHWKLFSRVNEEQSFRVLHMVWWDRNAHCASEEDERSDDILVAVIQYAHSDVSHLVGWSRRRYVMLVIRIFGANCCTMAQKLIPYVYYIRLGLGDDQLIIDSTSFRGLLDPETTFSSHSGLALSSLWPQSMSIISDPSGNNRALLLVTYDVPVFGKENVIEYAIYQLQAQTHPLRKSDVILSRLFTSGTTNLVSHTTSGIFLAGGSFSFQLSETRLDNGMIEGSISLNIITYDIDYSRLSANFSRD